ncbi:TFIIB-type zinc ribbon-containing protein [Aeoliella mucimassa]|uniref:Transcription factor zinc-finger domain-containing protein n=1 Tax=Aeoliella mucimassa TaxID=2527972 RepID=A0A518AT15_9BACT|nr:zf-TFIIB domain-containing protein [Aeoliella mucimassa]QDU57870.1 hypothetical protein Pan181_40930 [Aeoliella mucimassa]
MKCPRDGAELATVQVDGIELDKCHHCDGIWFDAGELDKVRKLERSAIEQELEREYGNPEVVAGKVDGYMRCPRCADGRLNELTYTYKKRVKIDRCDQCHGVWVDDNELDAIIGEQKQLQQMNDTSAIRAFMRAASAAFG